MGIKRWFCQANGGIELSQKRVQDCQKQNCPWLREVEEDEGTGLHKAPLCA